MQKKVSKKQPSFLKSSDKSFSGSKSGAKQPVKNSGKASKDGITTKRIKSMSAKKSHTRKRNKQGALGKGAGVTPSWKPFMK